MKQIEKLELLARAYKEVVVNGTEPFIMTGIDLSLNTNQFDELTREYIDNPLYNGKGLNSFSTRHVIYLEVQGIKFKIDRIFH